MGKLNERTPFFLVLFLNCGIIFSNCRNPSVIGLNPVQRNALNFLDVKNEGLQLGKSPNGDRLDFLGDIIRETIRLVRAHGDSPTETWIQQQCDTLTFENEEQSID